jgi:pimeloyl-ACP methyl ester carboxylesterase
LLDTAILLPFEPPVNALQRATYESSFFVWLSHQMVMRRPALMTRFMVDGVSDGLNRDQKKAEISWITSDPTRLRSMQEQFASIAPQKYRDPGWIADKANEHDLPPLPFADVAAPTLIAHGANDAIVPVDHATNAADRIADSEMILVAAGHHILSLSSNYGPVAQRQLELTRG